MREVGRVDSLWRYPVKSMRGERLDEAFVGFAGVYGDRVYAFGSSAAPKGFPFLTGRELAEMLLYQPRFRHPQVARMPPNLAEAESLPPGITPVYPAAEELAVDVESPSGRIVAVDDPALAAMLGDAAKGHGLSLMRSDRAMTDCRPVSLLSAQTIRQIGAEVGTTLDQRRFRANIYVELDGADGFGEDAFVGGRLRIGAKAVIAVIERDPRCKMITLDPETREASPEILRRVARGHEGMAGVYAAVLVEGMVRAGDAITYDAPLGAAR
jgi:uncharacterized protein YcbX